MRIRLAAAGIALAAALVSPAIPASADDTNTPTLAPTPTAPATPDDLGWGRTAPSTPAPTSTTQIAGDLGWG
ncbi:hypothetical protein AB0I93_26575 [Streptomyces sp. NPDC049967]|uniref:hypothetical protein n=1 Tax=Streptomyces sp. NPDC049967 TaxID=3155658 RepID=UPI003436B967